MSGLLSFMLLALFATTLGIVKGDDTETCTFHRISPGGCPDVFQCAEQCLSCAGGVIAFEGDCVQVGHGPAQKWQCHCNGVAGKTCPRPGCYKQPPSGPITKPQTLFHLFKISETRAIYHP